MSRTRKILLQLANTQALRFIYLLFLLRLLLLFFVFFSSRKLLVYFEVLTPLLERFVPPALDEKDERL